MSMQNEYSPYPASPFHKGGLTRVGCALRTMRVGGAPNSMVRSAHPTDEKGRSKG